ncbi:MAG: hypothetical protein BHW02_00760 [Clostridium sp. 28_12]|nr:MAG: hypothetical protein BHW02_00760 [Clostridium sp. 28_12]
MIISAFNGEIFIKTSLSREIHISISNNVLLSENAAINSESSSGLRKDNFIYELLFMKELEL